MIEIIRNYADYWLCFFVLTIGLHGVLLKRNYVKKIIGLTIFQSAIILFYVLSAYKEGGNVPVRTVHQNPENADAYISPLPHVLTLTAIVVGVATVGMALALLVRVYEEFETLDEEPLREKMK